MQAVFCSSRGAVGLSLAVHASRTVLGIRLILPIAFGWLQSRRNVASLFLGDVGFWSMHCLNVLSERTGVRVALGTARDFTHVWFLPREIFYCNSYCGRRDSALQYTPSVTTLKASGGFNVVVPVPDIQYV